MRWHAAGCPETPAPAAPPARPDPPGPSGSAGPGKSNSPGRRPPRPARRCPTMPAQSRNTPGAEQTQAQQGAMQQPGQQPPAVPWRGWTGGCPAPAGHRPARSPPSRPRWLCSHRLKSWVQFSLSAWPARAARQPLLDPPSGTLPTMASAPFRQTLPPGQAIARPGPHHRSQRDRHVARGAHGAAGGRRGAAGGARIHRQGEGQGAGPGR